MIFRVEATVAAEQDADEILGWLLAEHAGETGRRWFAALQKVVNSLAKFPARCPLAPKNAMFPFEVRHLLYGTKPDVYRILSRSRNRPFMFCISATDAANRCGTNQRHSFSNCLAITSR